MPSLTGSDLVRVLLKTDVVIADETVDLYVELATITAGDPCAWNSTSEYQVAVASLAAHNLIMEQVRDADGAQGPITGERAGEVSRQYGFNSNGVREDGLNLTSPGRRYLDLLKGRANTKFSSTSPYFQANRKKGC